MNPAKFESYKAAFRRMLHDRPNTDGQVTSYLVDEETATRVHKEAIALVSETRPIAAKNENASAK